MDTLINMKNNLIQNFYIIGFSPEDFFRIKKNNKVELINIFENKNITELNPKIISKFPPDNSNFNGINDEIIITHCFPYGLNIINNKQTNKSPIYFDFELDNLLFNYSIEEKSIYYKIYFSCLEIYEPLINYFKYKNEIKEISNKKIEIVNDVEESKEEYKNIFIPKVICFASILPFNKELYNILDILYKKYSGYSNDNNNHPIEKLIERIVLSIPIPLMSNTHIELLFKLNTDFQKISFPLFNIKERNIQLYYTNPISTIFDYFSIDDVLKIFKYILLEVPILFFCEHKTILSSFIETFITLLSPFKYVHPYISILPKKMFGLISTQSKYLFGINETFELNFFYKNGIEIDKNLIIISINIYKREGKIEEILKESNEENNNFFVIEDDSEKKEKDDYEEEDQITNDYVLYNGTKTDIINVELPSIKRKNLYEDIYNFISKIKGKKLEDEEYNYKIQSFFYKFFVYILAGYTDYYLNSKYFYESIKSKDCGNEILYKKNDKGMNDLNFVKEIFNYEEFIYKSGKDGQLFYYVFFQTKIFVNFLREIIYLNDKINYMAYKQFDQLTFLKKHEDYRKKKENKGVYEDFKKKPQDKSKKETIKEISFEKDEFNENEKNEIINKDKKIILMKYAQKVNVKNKNKPNSKISMNYYLFPKLLFDDEFFNIKYENLFFMHGIEMPISRTIEDFKSICSSYNDEYYKLRRYMFPPALIDKLPSTNNSKINFEVTSYYYIYFNWIILLCCSLWYCESIERIARLDEILIVLDKLNYIEEIVLKLLYITFLKYGNKIQCIKVHEKIKNFYGYSNYLFLNLLSNKLCEKENDKSIEKVRLFYKKSISFENEDNKKNGNK